MYVVLSLDYAEVGKLVNVGIFQRISANFRVLADILADIVSSDLSARFCQLAITVTNNRSNNGTDYGLMACAKKGWDQV